MKLQLNRTNRFTFFLVFCLLLHPMRVSAAQKETWVEVRSPNFVAYSDAGESEARSLLKQFEEIRNVFLQVFPNIRVDPPRPTVLLVLRDEASMKRFLPKSFEGKNPKRESGFFYSSPERNYALLRLDASSHLDRPYHVLFHEYTHGIVHLNFHGLPTWLDEGIADFYGTTEIRSDRVLIGGVSRDALRTIRERSLIPLETLLAVDQNSPYYRDGDKTGAFYSQSAMLVHYLFMDPQAKKAELLKKYFAALDKHSDSVTAGKEAFGDLRDLLGTLNSYTRQPIFHYWTYNLSARLSDKEFIARTLEPAQALVLRAEFLQISNQEAYSRPLLEEALKLNPALPEVHAAIGFGHLLRGESPQALAALGESRRLGSTDFRTFYQLARLEGGSQTTPDLKLLEILETARKLRPNFPPVHALLGQEFSKDPAQAARALEEMKLAIQLDPGNLSYLGNMGVICLNLRRLPEAKAVLEELKAKARTPWEKDSAKQLEESLRQFITWQETSTEPTNPSGPASAPATRTAPRPISFHLSSYLLPLGKEVLKLAQEGKVDEAIRKVEAAKAKAKYAFDQKSLQNLLDQLRGLKSP